MPIPNSLSAYISIGGLLDEQGRRDEAHTWFEKAMLLHSDSALPLGAIANSLARYGEHEAAEQWFRRAISRSRDTGLARLVFGAFLLMHGRFEEGLILYEERFSSERSDPFQRAPDTETPRWIGQDLRGSSIVICPEQGFGDHIQFCRYAALLKARGAAHVALVTHDPLTELFSSLEAVDEVLSYLQFKLRRDAYDYWSYVMSLPLYCGMRIDTIPASLPYLFASEERFSFWEKQLPQLGLRVGLVWKGNASHRNDINRSLPALAALSPLWSVPEIEFISLQKGPGEDETATSPTAQPILDLGSKISNFADTAVIVQQLDLVICVDTAIAHLAGAMAKPCWLLLSASADWRWHHERSDSPWYPEHLRLFRQTRPGDWSGAIQHLFAALKTWAAQATSRAQRLATRSLHRL